MMDSEMILMSLEDRLSVKSSVLTPREAVALLMLGIMLRATFLPLSISTNGVCEWSGKLCDRGMGKRSLQLAWRDFEWFQGSGSENSAGQRTSFIIHRSSLMQPGGSTGAVRDSLLRVCSDSSQSGSEFGSEAQREGRLGSSWVAATKSPEPFRFASAGFCPA